MNEKGPILPGSELMSRELSELEKEIREICAELVGKAGEFKLAEDTDELRRLRDTLHDVLEVLNARRITKSHIKITEKL
jgi:DNA polymerase elongation subunit (family B)